MNEAEQLRKIQQAMWMFSPYVWVKHNKIKNEKGKELEFKDHKFLKDVYDDWNPVQTVRKASQIGFSVMEMLKTLNAAKYRGWNVIYTLPTFSDVNELVGSKTNALISMNPILQQWTKDKDSITQKKVGNGFVYYRGTFSNKSEKSKMESGVGIMLSSDLNVHDECDRSDEEIMIQYESRLANSEYGGRWYFSNPTHPNTLSQKIYAKSDQKHWFIKCEHCNHWQYLDFWKNIKNGKYVCQKCQRELSDETRRNGQWVKRFKKDISGYWISHLMCPWIPASKIEEEFNNKSKQYFYNFILGLPYIGSDVVVNKDIILRNVDLTKPNFQERNVMGVDQGLKKHYVIGNQQGIFKIGCVEDWADIEKLIKIYDIGCAVFDALPDLTEPRKLRNKYPGKVWLNYYKKEVKKADFIKWEDKTHTVYSDRTKIIQQNIDDLIEKRTRFQIEPSGLTDYIRHWESVYKITEEDNMGIERDFWETSGTEDHYVHATNYWRIALERFTQGGGGIKSWEENETRDPTIAPEISKILEQNQKFEI